MFSSNFIWLFVAFFVFETVLSIGIVIEERSWYSFLKKKAFEPKPDWRNRLKYAIPIWIMAAFFIYIMIERFTNPEDYTLKYGIERLHISILFCLWTAVFLIGMGFHTLNLRKSRFERKGKIIITSRRIIYIIGLYSFFFVFADILINGVSYLYLINIFFLIASNYLGRILVKCDIKNE